MPILTVKEFNANRYVKEFCDEVPTLRKASHIPHNRIDRTERANRPAFVRGARSRLSVK